MTAPVGIHSEVGRLDTVIVHRPGRELGRLTPDNKDEMLFDEIPWPEGATAEHDALVAALRGRQVEVLYLTDLLATVMAVPAARKELIVAACSQPGLGQGAADALAGHLESLSDPDLLDALIGGVAMDQLAGISDSSLTGRLSRPGDFVLAPLPNHLFMRDSSMWIRDRVVVATMAAPARQREAAHMDIVYRFHPRFNARLERPAASVDPDGDATGGAAPAGISEPAPGGTDLAATAAPGPSGSPDGPLEGGDVLVAGPGVLLVGIGARTYPAAVERLARAMFADDRGGRASPPIREVVAVELPHERAVIHLDTVMTMVDHDVFTVYPPVIASVRAFRLRPAPSGLAVREEPDLASALAGALGLGGVRFLPTGGDRLDQQREQWSDANNVLALAPGVVLAYDRNVATNELLSAAGVDVLTVPSSELGRGRGGPRCLTCPVNRQPV